MVWQLTDVRRQTDPGEGMKVSLYMDAVLRPEANNSLLSEDAEQFILNPSIF